MRYLLLTLMLLIAPAAHAANVYFDPQDTSAGIGTPFVIAVDIDAEEAVNALTIVMSIPASLTPIDVSDGNSVIPFWIEEPHFDEATRLLSFSGIIPNGYTGARGRLLTVTFVPTAADQGALLAFAPGTEAFVGAGMPAPLVADEFVLPIVRGKTNIVDVVPDTEPPEAFVPEVVTDPLLADGRTVLVFSTTDKGSGIAGYEVRESWFRGLGMHGWKAAKSPYVLRDRDRSNWIEVRAVDKEGNRVTASIPPERLPYEPFAATLLVILAVLGFWYVKRKR